MAQDRYEGFFNNAAEGIFIVTVINETEFVFNTLNPRHAALIGITHEQMKGKTPQELLPPEVAAHVTERYRTCVAARQPIEYDESLLLPSGTHLFHTILTPIFDSSGRIVLLQGSARDVTARMHAEAASKRLAAILEATPHFVAISSPTGERLFANRALRHAMGIGEEESLAGMKALNFYAPWAAQRLRQQGVPTAIRDGVWNGETALRTRAGCEIPVLQSLVAHKNEAGGVDFFSTIFHDNSHVKAAEERLRLLESAVENANDGVIIADARSLDEPNPCVLYVNKAFTQMTGYAPHEIVGKTPRILQGANTDRTTLDVIRQKLSRWESFTIEVENVKKDGTPFWVELSLKPLADPCGWYTHWISVQRNITERRTMEAERERLYAEAIYQAERDSLTGLLNHRAFYAKLERHTAQATAEQPLSVVLLDLDNFKFFNDAYGHLIGDAVLAQVADALRSVCEEEDCAARFGGDEFALAFVNCPSGEASRRVQRLRVLLEECGYRPPQYDTPIPLTLSAGVATYPLEAVNSVETLHLADTRLMLDKQGSQEEITKHLRASLNDSVEGFSMLDALVTAVDKIDRYTRRHSEDIVIYGVMIAREMGLSPQEQETIQIAALLHDVGKIGVPDQILRKPGRLSDEDYLTIQQHPMIGAMMVASIPGLEKTLDAVRYHHERWDGTGYPAGLKGEDIPRMARLMAVADAFSAMTTDRPYRKAMSHAHALRILEAGAGVQWDPACVAAFLRAHAQTFPLPLTDERTEDSFKGIAS